MSFRCNECFLEAPPNSTYFAGTDGYPALTMFLWQNRAAFDSTMNRYMSAPFPAGIDPREPAILKVFGPYNSSVDAFNGTLPEGIEFGRPMPLVKASVLDINFAPSPSTVIDTLLTDLEK